jgi:rfaE bifunctional protein kinase chain/domain
VKENNFDYATVHNSKILVVGDVMLDRYWFSEVKRISPEAPVPIAKVMRAEDRPGGAANVARNIASLGAKVTLLSVVGDDSEGVVLSDMLKADGVKVCLKLDKSIKTIVKLRVVAQQQQLLRVDFEESPSHEILNSALEDYSKLVDEHDVIILSDYGKGGLNHITKMIAEARSKGKVILVDPKGNDYERYRGATVITPNRKELQEALGLWSNEAELYIKAENFRKHLELNYLLVTRSEEGMSLFMPSKVQNYKAVAREVFDVSGAGDTVIAVLATMLGAEVEIEDAVSIANQAASVVVAKLGTAVVTKDELIDILRII